MTHEIDCLASEPRLFQDLLLGQTEFGTRRLFFIKLPVTLYPNRSGPRAFANHFSYLKSEHRGAILQYIHALRLPSSDTKLKP